MLALVLGGVVLITYMIWRWTTPKGDLGRIPGPSKGRYDGSVTHHHVQALFQKYGPLVRTEIAGQRSLLLSDYESIKKVLVTEGKAFGGRSENYKFNVALKNTGIAFSKEPDAKWRRLRQVAQKHLKQFGNGLTRLESVITEVGEDMIDTIDQHARTPFDPRKTIFDTALNSIAFLITGQRTYVGDKIVEKMREFEGLFMKTLPVFQPFKFRLLDICPALKYVGFDNWEPFNRLIKLRDETWQTVKQMNHDDTDSESICKILNQHMTGDDSTFDEDDSKVTSLALLFAGVATTSATFYCGVSILAHRKDVQMSIESEITELRKSTGKQPSLPDRPQMPYTQAFILELHRYASILPISVPHRTTQTTELHGYTIPKDTEVHIAVWNLHHNEDFWGDPFEFRPDRYLDDTGALVAADHPYRTHLIPFGAGTRVCVGEALANARIFLWMTNMLARYEITPAPGNEVSSSDCRNYRYLGTLMPTSCDVIFTPR